MTDAHPHPNHAERGDAPDDPGRTALLRVLTEVQRRGGIGRGPVSQSIEHASWFVHALPPLPAGARLVDLGSGGGLPGLVIVARRPDLHVTLVERRAKRADLLRYGVRALDATDRVEVVVEDIDRIVGSMAQSFDVVTARSFAPPRRVLDVSSALLTSPGWLLVAEPPDARTWPLVEADDLIDDGTVGPLRRFHRPVG